MVRAPMLAPCPTNPKAPMVADGSTRASAASDASAWIPGGGVRFGASAWAARANVRYGDLLRITAHGAASLGDAVASPFMITALAFVAASFDAYFGLARNV